MTINKLITNIYRTPSLSDV